MKAISLILVFSIVFIIGCEEKNIPPTWEIISPSIGEEYYVGDTITISVNAEDEDGTIAEVRFYIDDIGVASASSFPYNYQWNTLNETEGIKKIKVSAKDDKGAITEDEISILLNLGGEPPVAAFTAANTTITEGESIQFTDQSTNDPTSWSWNFGDGGTSSEKNPSHTYSIAGIYTVILEVTNQYGSNTETKTNYITVTESGGGETGTFTDARDGKTYKTINIGTQTWMAENLAYLPSVVGPGTGSYTTSYQYVYGYNGTSVSEAKATSNFQTYGVLYNWPAAMNGATSSTANPSGVQGICPTGWHLPSDAEWSQLTNYLNDEHGIPNTNTVDGAGNALKSCRQIGSPLGGECATSEHPSWNAHSTHYGTDQFGFSALPSGHRGTEDFHNLGYSGRWWSSTETTSAHAWRRHMDFNYGAVYSDRSIKELGFSVRCVRENVRTDDD